MRLLFSVYEYCLGRATARRSFWRGYGPASFNSQYEQSVKGLRQKHFQREPLTDSSHA